MRAIKFRVWDKYKKSFVKDYIGIRPDGEIVRYNIWYDDSPDAAYADESWTDISDDGTYSISESTGITDNAGVEIYEGDILERPNDFLPNFFEVYWNKEAAKFHTHVHMKHHKMVAIYPVVAADFGKMKLVGNIFENPELLKKV